MLLIILLSLCLIPGTKATEYFNMSESLVIAMETRNTRPGDGQAKSGQQNFSAGPFNIFNNNRFNRVGGRQGGGRRPRRARYGQGCCGAFGGGGYGNYGYDCN
ncbi:hypothetical protein HDE_04868 [Halotydeus destructor]|nr:hypothetical protein HDE_04868 [Halotydeus destructor]